MAHVSEELLEQHARGAISDFKAEWVERHLVVCRRCWDRLETEPAFLTVVFSAASKALKRRDLRVFRHRAVA